VTLLNDEDMEEMEATFPLKTLLRASARFDTP
jgi:hypothetical protein